MHSLRTFTPALAACVYSWNRWHWLSMLSNHETAQAIIGPTRKFVSSCTNQSTITFRCCSKASIRTLLTLSAIPLGMTMPPCPALWAQRGHVLRSYGSAIDRLKITDHFYRAYTHEIISRAKDESGSLPPISAQTLHCTTAMAVDYALERKPH